MRENRLLLPSSHKAKAAWSKWSRECPGICVCSRLMPQSEADVDWPALLLLPASWKESGIAVAKTVGSIGLNMFAVQLSCPNPLMVERTLENAGLRNL